MKLPRSPRGVTLLTAALALAALFQVTAAGAPPQPTDPSGIQVSGTDTAESVIINDGSHWTLIPRASVIFLPEEHFAKIGGRPVGTLLSWEEFCEVNRSWLTAEKVSLRQADGEQALDSRRMKYLEKSGNVVVAVYKRGPIGLIDQPMAISRIETQ